MSAKGADLFRGQISPDFGPLGDYFYPSKSVVENKCFIEHPRHPFRDKNFLMPRCRIGEVCAPTKSAFHSGERFLGLSTSRRKGTVRRDITKKSGSLLAEPLNCENRPVSVLPPFYFQSLKISSNAASNADCRPFSMILNISASRVDFFFFFLSLSFFYWLILSLPHL